MSLQYTTTHRTTCMSDLITAVGSTGYLLIYNGTPPANVATGDGNTILVSLPLSNPIGVSSGGVLTFSTITSAAAGVTGTATHFRICTSSAGTTCIIQGTVGTSGADLNFAAGVGFTVAETISVSSFTITATGA